MSCVKLGFCHVVEGVLPDSNISVFVILSRFSINFSKNEAISC